MNRTYVPRQATVALIGAILFLGGCERDEVIVPRNQIAGSGRIVSQLRNVGSFSGIQITNIGDVYITQDTVESLRIEADDNIVDLVQTSVAGGTLSVGLREGSYSNVTVRIHASMQQISSLESVGAGEFHTTGAIHTDKVTCRITGAGAISLSGTATEQIVEISGAGSIDNFGLVSSLCTVTVTGTGSVGVNVTQELHASVSGTGTITYDGNPPLVHSSITGTGTIRPK